MKTKVRVRRGEEVTQIAIWIPVELFHDLATLARAEGRNMTDQIIIMLEEDIEEVRHQATGR